MTKIAAAFKRSLKKLTTQATATGPVSTVVQYIGFGAVIEGGFQINRTAGCFIAGAVLVFVGHAMDR